ncbi:uncharacterized protein LOC124454131 [Xenia sp. Carnegie-2017]|uniref:uncharacterized protein LOC124454131 n=1 Tax=Xenia sp. Carnegie-2017 TaxID=2897299 RepID=UPI001F0373D7|nr:uncharacterized protein LOC124454131 [Xenia sp. Carnegie-2017]
MAVEWTRDKVERLAELWEAKPVLYNTTLPDYHDRVARRNAIAEIASALEMSAMDVSCKIKNLRSQFCKEIAKGTKPKSGSATDDVTPKSKWQYLTLLLFLKDHVECRSSRSNLDKERSSKNSNTSNSTFLEEEQEQKDDNNELDQNVSITSSTKRPINVSDKESRATKAQKRDIEERGILKKAGDLLEIIASGKKSSLSSVHVSSADESTDDLFGRYIASEIKCIENDSAKRLAKVRIQNILFEAQSTSVCTTFSTTSPVPYSSSHYSHSPCSSVQSGTSDSPSPTSYQPLTNQLVFDQMAEKTYQTL